MPPEPSVTSACEGPRSCTLRYSSALLPKSFERPGPKSVSPAMYCSGVDVVVWCRWIVDIRAPFRFLRVPQSAPVRAPREPDARVQEMPAIFHEPPRDARTVVPAFASLEQRRNDNDSEAAYCSTNFS